MTKSEAIEIIKRMVDDFELKELNATQAKQEIQLKVYGISKEIAQVCLEVIEGITKI